MLFYCSQIDYYYYFNFYLNFNQFILPIKFIYHKLPLVILYRFLKYFFHISQRLRDRNI